MCASLIDFRSVSCAFSPPYSQHSQAPEEGEHHVGTTTYPVTGSSSDNKSTTTTYAEAQDHSTATEAPSSSDHVVISDFSQGDALQFTFRVCRLTINASLTLSLTPSLPRAYIYVTAHSRCQEKGGESGEENNRACVLQRELAKKVFQWVKIGSRFTFHDDTKDYCCS